MSNATADLSVVIYREFPLKSLDGILHLPDRFSEIFMVNISSSEADIRLFVKSCFPFLESEGLVRDGTDDKKLILEGVLRSYSGMWVSGCAISVLDTKFLAGFCLQSS